MTRRLLVVIFTIILAATWAGLATAGETPYNLRKAYNMDKAEEGFSVPPKGEPSAAVVAGDAILARPLGLATTIVGTGVFVVTLPFSACSESVDTAAWGLVGRPGGWTFVRPMGKGDPRFEEKSIFK